jgi:cell division protein FtsW
MKPSGTAAYGDKWLLIAVFILLLIGTLMVYSASSFRGAEKYNDYARFLKQHILHVFLGILVFFILSRIDYHRLPWITPLLLLLLLILLFIVLREPEFHGSRRSILLLGKRFQPSELMKLTIILYLAAVFAKGREAKAQDGKVLIVHSVLLLITVGLVFIEPDLGTAMVVFFIGFSMFFLGGVQWKHLIRLVSFLALLFCMGMVLFPYQRQRITDFFGSLLGSAPMNYQVKQSIIGLAQGGLTGVGYGVGKQKLYFLPEPFSDFILSCLGEELGFLGVLFIFILLSFILWRGIRIALKAPDRYGYLLAGGITAMILINALVNAGVALHLLPTTGLPFPFLSYGGSSLLVHLMGAGILINISRQKTVTYKEYTWSRGHSGHREMRESKCVL